MDFKTLDDPFFLQLNMKLASITYAASRADIVSDLKDVTLLTSKGFELKWYGTGPGTQMYVAAPVGSPANFVCIRGTVTNFYSEAFWVDWLGMNTRVFDQVSWPFSEDGVPSNALVAKGESIGLEELANMEDSVTGQKLVPYLQSVMPNMLFVNGHSLGGALATGWSLHLQAQTAHMVLPYTFAAPTIGTVTFAQYMNKQFSGMYFARTYNTLDNAPNFWSVAGMETVQKSYDPQPSIPLVVDGLVEAVKLIVETFDEDYQHVHDGQGAALEGTLNLNNTWFTEVGDQHSHLMYLWLLKYPGAQQPPS